MVFRLLNFVCAISRVSARSVRMNPTSIDDTHCGQYCIVDVLRKAMATVMLLNEDIGDIQAATFPHESSIQLKHRNL